MDVRTIEPNRDVVEADPTLKLQRIQSAVQQNRGINMSQWTLVRVVVLVENLVTAVARGITIDVVAPAAIQRVRSVTAVQRVTTIVLIGARDIPGAPLQQIITGPAFDNVVVITAIDGVIPGAAGQGVIAVITVDRIRPFTTRNDVLAEPAVDRVGAGTAGQRVVKTTRSKGVIAIAGANLGGGLVPGEVIRARRGLNISHHVGYRHRAAVRELKALDPAVGGAPILDNDPIIEIQEFGAAVA